MSSTPPRDRYALVRDTVRSQWVTGTVWVVGGGAANLLMGISLRREMDDYPGGPAALAASVLPASEAMRPLRWPANHLETLGGYLTFHNIVLFTFFLTIWGAIQGARAVRGAEDRHWLELVLATGWPRAAVVRDRLLGFLVTDAYVSLGLGLSVAAALAAGREPNLGGALATFGAVGLCVLAGYGLGVLLAQLTRSARTAAGLAGVVLTTLYVVSNSWENLAGLRWLRFASPFYYWTFSRATVPGHSFDVPSALVTLGMAALLTTVAAWAFARRDYAAALWTTRRERTARSGPAGWPVRAALASPWSAMVVRGRYGLLAWAGSAAVFGWLMMFLEPSVMGVWDMFATFLPGGGLSGASASARYVSFATEVVIPFVAGYVINQAAAWAADLSQGRVELALASPVSWVRLVVERVLAATVGTAVVSGAAILGLVLGVAGVDVALDASGLARLAAESILLGAALAGVAVAVVAAFRGTAAVTVLGVLVGASYLVGYLTELLGWPDWTYRLSIFSLFGHPYLEWPPVTDVTVLAVACLLATALATGLAVRSPKVA
ncbi:MAG TPA: ABC transporter permease subunit [Propionibacteriaceae bacterium]|nr:ABC transporter permease subunit [Propionibacteriaceae bacterium]